MAQGDHIRSIQDEQLDQGIVSYLRIGEELHFLRTRMVVDAGLGWSYNTNPILPIVKPSASISTFHKRAYSSTQAKRWTFDNQHPISAIGKALNQSDDGVSTDT